MPEMNNGYPMLSGKNPSTTTAIAAHRVVAGGDNEGEVVYPSLSNTFSIGITQAEIPPGESGALSIGPVCWIEAAAPFAINAVLVVGGAYGKVVDIADSSNPPSGSGIVGNALRAATKAGDIVPVFMKFQSVYLT